MWGVGFRRGDGVAVMKQESVELERNALIEYRKTLKDVCGACVVRR